MATSNEASAEMVDLLSQFKCMGTSDRDTLIKELYTLLDGQISRDQCAFILEMSSWNLQNAVGAFYDYLGSSPIEDLSLKVEGSVLEPHGPIVTGTRFSLTWVVVNTGPIAWPVNTRLAYQSGYFFSGILEGPIGEVKSGERKMITVSIFCPPVGGYYRTEMRLRCEGGYFGNVLPIEIEAVESDGVACLTERLSVMTTSSSLGYSSQGTESYHGLEEENNLSSSSTLPHSADFNDHSSSSSVQGKDSYCVNNSASCTGNMLVTAEETVMDT